MFGRFVTGLGRGLAASRLIGSSSSKWRAKSSQAGQSTSGGRGMHPVAKAAITSAGMSALGDLLAQTLTQTWGQPRDSNKSLSYDLARVARMFGFGLVFYGPYQHYWYSLLDWRFPTKTPQHFLTKVFLNQTVLAPVTLTVVFSWNLFLTRQSSDIANKIRTDLVPTMINGWKFWVPAASINFCFVPLQQQVLYMSTCSVLWTAYLSYMSNTSSRGNTVSSKKKAGKKQSLKSALSPKNSPAEL